MHFGENQLSPRSVGISPLPTSHPPVLQHWWVRASTDFHIRFTLLMGSSRGFGSLDGYLPRSHKPGTRPVQTRFPSGSPPLLGVNRATAKHSPDHSTKGTPSAPWWLLPQWPLTAGAFAGSGSLSSPLRGAFHLSLTVLVRYRSRQLFSLGGWSPRLPTGFPVSRGTQDLRLPSPGLPLRDCHPLGCGFPTASGRPGDGINGRSFNPGQELSPLPGLGCSPFARHYSGNLV